MCLNMMYYPLVVDDLGKKRILFNYFVRVNDRDTFDDMLDIQKECVKAHAGISKYSSLNTMFKKENFKEVLKMVSIPCGKCAECLQNTSREWSYRIYLESLLYPDKCWFITLTYDDDNLPIDNMLIKDEISKFNKKLKTYLKRKNINSEFRFYGTGEYGSKGLRPHYHIIYFNLDIPDLKYVGKSKKGYMMFESDFINNVWSKGFVTIQDVTIASACYVAKYADKKKRLPKEERIRLVDNGIVPEFSVMSRMPGIGSQFLGKLENDFKKGFYTHYVNGKPYNIPVAWRKKIKADLEGTECLFDYEEFADIKSSAKISRLLEIGDNTDLSSYLSGKDVIKTKRIL